MNGMLLWPDESGESLGVRRCINGMINKHAAMIRQGDGFCNRSIKQ
jgi:hypothetical protein